MTPEQQLRDDAARTVFHTLNEMSVGACYAGLDREGVLALVKEWVKKMEAQLPDCEMTERTG